jgi:ABC-type antimicrobial peptide transport system permease subunit
MALAAPVRELIRTLDPDVLVLRTRTMERALGVWTAEQRALTSWTAALSALALLLAAIGIFGMVARSATQRTHELGIRVALGASRASIVRSVLGRTLLLATLGAALGVGASYVVAQSMRSLLYGVAPGDPATLACAALVVMATALTAGYVPARRAAKVDPMVALRCE